MTTIIQVNLNKSRGAQDLLLHHAEELGAAVCVVSEPTRTPSSQQWFYSGNGLATLYISRIARHPAVLLTKGRSSVIIKYGNICIASCYISPNTDYNGYSDFLDELTILCSSILNNHYLLICGDFNAHATLWGSRSQNFKGDLLEDWVAQADVRLINTGNKPTFVSARGSSIIDLTWASPSLMKRIHHWSVRDDLESLSDHVYVTFKIDSLSKDLIVKRPPR
ncbi:uncharacterized protein [Temnothorax longispinosus]|uniref:uncharacterized protein n=1 Tax=Temnothorax longispinosus TaxID=300112 RepID=UPI003A98EAE7